MVIDASFERQILLQGERKPVMAEFVSGAAWSASSVRFTLWANGMPADGYSGISAELAADSSGRLYTAYAIIDLTPETAYPLLPGIYRGEFLLTTSNGEIIGARGPVTIVSAAADPPGEYGTGGGLS